MYRVIKYFTDVQDHNYAYHVGDEYPHEGVNVSQSRINELASKNNRQGTPLIEKVEEPKPRDEANDNKDDKK